MYQKSVDFWKSFDTTHVLQFQWDSIVCSNSPNKFEDFAKYDFIGAPFIESLNNKTEDFYVFNSGLSLRNVKRMVWFLESLTDAEMKSNIPEDTWYCLFFIICFPLILIILRK